ncbi:MAG: N-6 DNA methylase [Proteobacteria bacterium]|nr:N-6 DNA methylase [Pseudomonadota bacterium]
MAAPKELQNLVDIFDRNIEDYKSGRFNEAQVRQQFLDPFFEILGWDVANKQGWSEAYKEVVHEDSLKIAGKYKAPDYSFRIGRERKFFVEAKKPSVDVKNDPAPAYQVRRYAWSAKLPLSIVTDFEEFAVYDCRVKPARKDKSSAARVKYLRYTDYADEWDFIEGLFSKDAILKGAFDKYAESHKAKRGTAEVDDAFLDEIEIWREILAKNFRKKNPDLGPRDLNYAVQATIDRVIFLRICEDRGIEPYGRLEILQNGANVYGRLFDQFREADQRYNSGLFHFRNERGRTTAADQLTPKLKLDDKPLKQMMKGLYYPDCPYEFSMLSADILGQIYERFLGNVITITGRRVKIEQKPEVRKAGGVYYTPTYIVNYIVENTVGKLLENKTARQAASIKILDPACGSGSFLIGAYQYLLDWYLGWYLDHGPGKHKKAVFKVPPKKKGDEPSWHLTLAERKHILLNNIHGVDIDSQAVEVTKLSLLLKVLEDREAIPRQQELAVFKQRLLPDLDENIRCGNSLIESDFYDQGELDLTEEDRYRINVFDWDGAKGFPTIIKNGGFDAVIGNPPYIRVRLLKDLQPKALTYYLDKYRCATHVWDIYLLFYERGLTLLKNGGRIAFIIPIQTLHQPNCESLRRLLLENTAICFISDLSQIRVFRDAIVKTCIIVSKKGKNNKNYIYALAATSPENLFFGDRNRWPQKRVIKNPSLSFKISLISDTRILCEKLIENSWKLDELCYVTFGLRSSSKCPSGKKLIRWNRL